MANEPEIPNLFQLVGPPIVEDPGTIYDYDASAGEAWSGGVDRTIDSFPLTGVIRNYQFLGEDLKGLINQTEWVDQATAQAEAGDAQIKIDVPAGGVSRFELNALKYLKRREAEQNMIAERTRTFGASVAGFTGGMAASLADPINIASAFIPVVSQARYAAWLRAAGSPAGRFGVRAGVGALEGAVGAAAIEPLVIAGASAAQLDYTAADSFLNVAFGTILGGGLHSIGGAVVDVASSRLRDYAGLAPDQVKMDALERSVKALEEDRAVDAESAFFAEMQRRNGVTDTEFVRRAPDFDDEALRDARATVVMGRAGEDEKLSTPGLLAVIKRLGGIKVRGADGTLTREGAEVMAVLQDVRYPGLINNKSGRPPDSVLEARTEDGWFQSRDRGQTDLTEMYDMMDRAARGERVQPFGDLPPMRLKAEAVAELEAAGITQGDSVASASVKLAEYRQGLQRQRFADDPDFEPDEIVWREPGEEDPLAGPVSDEMLARYERVEGIDNWEVEQASFSRMADEALSRGEADLAQVADDVNFVDAQIEGMKARGLWSNADEAALQLGEVKARDLEGKAALYRAAAVCMME